MSSELNTDRYIHRGSVDYSDEYGRLIRIFGCRACGSLVADPDRITHDENVHDFKEPLTS